MKAPILPIIVIVLILGGAYYYFFVMKKPGSTSDEEKPKEKEKEYILGQPAPDHSSEAIASMFSGQDWRNNHPILI